MTRKKSVIIAIACVVIALPAVMAAYVAQSQKAQDAPADRPQTPQQNQTIKVDVDLVMVTATVTDAQNRYVTGLEQEHFQVWEDKLEQKIEYFSAEDVPISLGVIFDTSGSMKDKISTARDAAVTFLKTGNPEDEYFLVEFANRPQVAEDFTTDVTRLQNKLIFTPAKGMTAMYDSVYLGLEKLKEGNNPKKALLRFTNWKTSARRLR